MSAPIAYILAGVLAIACAGVGYGYIQHQRAEAAVARAKAADEGLQQAIHANAGNIDTLGKVRVALVSCNAQVAENAERNAAAIKERDRMYGELAVKYDQSRATLARALSAECKDWASEPVCVASVLSD